MLDHESDKKSSGVLCERNYLYGIIPLLLILVIGKDFSVPSSWISVSISPTPVLFYVNGV